MSKSVLVDTTLCTACKGCQVACKQWHDLPPEKTRNMGSFQNPQDLSFDTYKLVRMEEAVVDGQLKWLFFPDQCRHCLEPPCRDAAGDTSAIFSDSITGAVVYTANTKGLPADEIRESCPYNIPRQATDGTLAKCDMCNDRVQNGLLPACVKACPTGAMSFGDRSNILTLAEERLNIAKKRYPQASLIDPGDVRVIFLVAYDPLLYNENAIAGNVAMPMTRQAALRRMFRPFSRVISG